MESSNITLVLVIFIIFVSVCGTIIQNKISNNKLESEYLSKGFCETVLRSPNGSAYHTWRKCEDVNARKESE